MSNHDVGIVQRRELAAMETTRSAETAGTAAAVRSRAEIEAAYALARQFPRDFHSVRRRVLEACKRPMFAEKAVYELERRSWNREANRYETTLIRGGSIRFAEEAKRAMGHILNAMSVVYDDDRMRICRVASIDLETNAVEVADFTVAKTIERRKLRKDEVPLEERVGADGSKVFICLASEGDVRMKQNAEYSRVKRNHILGFLDSDIVEEAREQIRATLADEHARDPKAGVKALVDKYAAKGVAPAQLTGWLGRPIEQATFEELGRLKSILVAIHDGETTWDDEVATREQARAEKGLPGPEDKAEKAKLIKLVAETRVGEPKIYAAAREYAGVADGVREAGLPIETLRKMAESINAAKAPAPKPAAKKAEPAENEQDDPDLQAAIDDVPYDGPTEKGGA